MIAPSNNSPARKAGLVRARLPKAGLFAGQEWRISPEPFLLSKGLVNELEALGRVLLQFYRSVNLLYRQSVAGKEPRWVAEWLDQGKPAHLLEVQRSPALKNDLPRVIRPDLLLTEAGVSVTELDSVPGGIGLTGWLNQVYAALQAEESSAVASPVRRIMGGSEGMLRGFEGIFGDAPQVHIVVSEEAATYRPEMAWVAEQLGGGRFRVQPATFTEVREGEAVYRFFELFDLPNIPSASHLIDLAIQKKIRLTPPPKPLFEEKMLFALLWNGNLRGFWRRELGQSFFERLLRIVPDSWLIHPGAMPPYAGIPRLDLTDWQQLKTLSQKERELILKVSGFSEAAWGARGVYLGSDLSHGDWSGAVDLALREFPRSPYVLQRFARPTTVDAEWFDFTRDQLVRMKARVRLCPFYFVVGDGDSARAQLGGVLATVCPAEKKIIHGMTEAILAPCAYEVD